MISSQQKFAADGGKCIPCPGMDQSEYGPIRISENVICDSFNHCPNGADEDGSMGTCIHSKPFQKVETTNSTFHCCSDIRISHRKRGFIYYDS